MAVTIRDIADLLGTSVATVSRVLNDKPGVAPARRARVLQVARDLGYSPNRSARSLVLQRSQFIGFVVADLSNPRYIDFLRCIESIGRERGHQVLIADSAHDLEQERQNLEAMVEHRVAGLLVFPVAEYHRESTPEHFLDLHARRVPFVLLGNVGDDGLDAVLAREEEVGALLARHLLDLGHRRLAIAGSSPGSCTVEERCTGVRKAVRAFGEGAVVVCDDAGMGADGWRAALARSDRPTGVVAINDEIALWFLTVLRDGGLSAPDDLSVASVDNLRWSSNVRPSLTTADACMEERAQRGMEMLFARMAAPDAPPMREMLSYRLIPRGSSGPPPARVRRYADASRHRARRARVATGVDTL